MNNFKKVNIYLLNFFIFCLSLSTVNAGVVTPSRFFIFDKKLPIGLNLPIVSYYGPELLFNDVMKTADFRADRVGVFELSRDKFDLFQRDSNGYPTQVPATIDGNSYRYIAYINSFYSGEYALLYDGAGDVSITGVDSSVIDGVRRFTLPGALKNIWITVSSVVDGNHVRNIRIIPVEYLGNEAAMPTFRDDYINGVRPFHSMRFMDLTRTNNSDVQEWADRITVTSYSQGSLKGAAWEYVIQLSNQLGIDPWICIPHKASDDYIVQLANLFKNTLNADRKIYLEFSNEMWNWGFAQAGYVLQNAPGHLNNYVTQDLAALGTINNVTVSGSTFSGSTLPNGEKVMFSATADLPQPIQAYTQYFVVNTSGVTFQVAATSGGAAIPLTTTGSGVRVHKSDKHPEKDAYMMARAFRLFGTVFGEQNPRVVRVATSQQAWVDNSRRILKYLFETDGIGADALAVGGYFYFDPADHNTWVAMDPESVTPEMILQSANSYYPAHGQAWTRQTAAYANQYGVDYLVYEGGQHMQPHNQGDWAYNHAVWDAQIHPGMYDMYMTNFATHTESEVNCKMFMAFSYISARKSRYGSWGHLENLGQLNSPETLKASSPKYKALLDINKVRTNN